MLPHASLPSTRSLLCVLALAAAAPVLAPGSAAAQASAAKLSAEPAWSSSAPAEPTPSAIGEGSAEPAHERSAGFISSPIAARNSSVHAFRAFAVQAKIGSGGIGFDVATPLNRYMNLRSGAQFFGHTTTFTTNGLDVTGQLNLQNAQASVDIFPFHNAFRISPGITFHSDNHLRADLMVPGGQQFSLGDGNYTSDPTDPIRGVGRIIFGNPVAPRLTIGAGNMIPRNGGRISFPVEIGFQYISPPTIQLSLTGSACDSQGCGSINQGDGPANLQQQIKQFEDQLSPFRFYPIASVGISFRLGHGGNSIR